MNTPNRKTTPRRQFVTWLAHQLELSGANLPEPFTYAALRDAVEAQWIKKQPMERQP
jgi:hypothetical protein